MWLFSQIYKLKGDLRECKCLVCNSNCQIKFDEKLKERLFNRDNNKFILLLRKGVYPYEYINDWEKFNETSLPPKEDFYNDLNTVDINDADYVHTKGVCKDFFIYI